MSEASINIEGILLAGASSDIGRVLARRLARHEGLKLLLSSRSSSHASSLVQRPNTRVVDGIDFANESDVERLTREATDFFGGPFALIHSVGDFWTHRPIVDCDPSVALDMMRSHYMTLYTLAHRLLPLMAIRGGGRVLAFSCTSVQAHYPEMAAFTSAKAAVECLVRCIANEWSPQRIAANAIALSTIGTPKVQDTMALASEENYVTPKEICTLIEDIVFAESPHLSGNVIRPLKHSHTFYHRAYFERNPPFRRGGMPTID